MFTLFILIATTLIMAIQLTDPRCLPDVLASAESDTQNIQTQSREFNSAINQENHSYTGPQTICSQSYDSVVERNRTNRRTTLLGLFDSIRKLNNCSLHSNNSQVHMESGESNNEKMELTVLNSVGESSSTCSLRCRVCLLESTESGILQFIINL